MCSCSTAYHCRKCLSGGGIKSDSTVTTKVLPADSATIGFTVTPGDSLEWNKFVIADSLIKKAPVIARVDSGRLHLVVKYLPGKEKRIYVQGKCDSVVQTKYIRTTTTINTGITLKEKIGYGVVILAIGLILGFFFKR